MSDTSYNGWSNWESWNVALWVNNEEPMYRAMRRGLPYTASEAEAFCKELMPDGTPDMDSPDGGYDAVDWVEVASDFNAE